MLLVEAMAPMAVEATLAAGLPTRREAATSREAAILRAEDTHREVSKHILKFKKDTQACFMNFFYIISLDNLINQR